MNNLTLQQIISGIFASVMRDKGITEAELARRLNVSRTNVHQMWDQRWTLDRAERIARALGVNFHIEIKPVVDNRSGPQDASPGTAAANTATEDRLYAMTFHHHKMRGHNQDFERCEDAWCIQTRGVLNITGYGHRWDKAYQRATKFATTIEPYCFECGESDRENLRYVQTNAEADEWKCKTCGNEFQFMPNNEKE